LFGRERERGVLDRLLDGGRGGVLVVHGEAGAGKTALLEYAAEAGREFRIARAFGVEAEMELPYAAVQQLCSPFFELMKRLQQPQHDALGVAFGLTTGLTPNRFLVGLAVLGLLAEAAEEQPLVCVVDDAQWLDSASERTLAFVARRLVAEQIALVFATREPGDALADLPELHVAPLGRRDARALLESVLPARLDEHVLDRIVAETRGNPLALLGLPRGLSPTQLAGGFGLPQAVPVSASIEESFMRRLDTLPRQARRLLLVAAADPVGDPALVWRAAERLRIPESAAHTVESEALLALSPRVVFRHPPVRSAVYGAAELTERREVHSALALALAGVKLLRLEQKGRGRALRAAWSASDARVVCYMDVDLSTDLKGLLPLVAPLLAGHSELAIGTRLASGSRVTRGAKREFISRSYNHVLRLALHARFSDAQCGFKAVRADVLEELLADVRDQAWFFDTELLILAQRQKLRIHEVPVDWVDDPDSTVHITSTALADLRGVARLGWATPIVRFMSVGILSTLTYVLLFLALSAPLGSGIASAVALAITAVGNTAINRRLTFGVRGRKGLLSQHAAGASIFAIALGLTTAALAVLHGLDPHAPRTAELAVLVVANLTATVTRYVALRAWVFKPAPRGARPQPRTHHALINPTQERS
jgi:putative flippase GtrA